MLTSGCGSATALASDFGKGTSRVTWRRKGRPKRPRGSSREAARESNTRAAEGEKDEDEQQEQQPGACGCWQHKASRAPALLPPLLLPLAL